MSMRIELRPKDKAESLRPAAALPGEMERTDARHRSQASAEAGKPIREFSLNS
jgi:hypothetical protein